MTLILSATPLSAEFRDELARTGVRGPLDAVTFETLAALRSKPLPAMLRSLLARRGEVVVIALQDEASRPLLPLLALVSLASLPRRLDVARPNEVRSRLDPLTLGRMLLSLGFASVRARTAVRAAAGELEKLRGAPRLPDPPFVRPGVLYLNANLWFGLRAGGSVGHTAGVINALRDAGHPVDFAGLTDPVLLRPDVGLVDLPLLPLGMPFELNHYALQETIVRRLVARARDRRYGLIYQRMSVHSYAGAVVSRHLRIPLVLEYNGSEVWVAQNWGRPLRYPRLAAAAEETVLRHAHVVVTVSEVLRDELIARGVEPFRVAFYPNCVDPRLFSPDRFPAAERAALRERLGLPADAVVATFIGTFGRWHGVEVLAHAIRRLDDEASDWLRERRLRFLIVGDGLRAPEARAILGDAVGRLVVMPGLVPQEEAPAYLAISDILLSPHVANEDQSRFFGSPTKLFEYMAMARPIVASALGQIETVLSPALSVRGLSRAPSAAGGEVAIVVRPGDVGELIAGIRVLVEHPEWRDVLSANARSRVIERYTWRHHVDVILERVQAVAGARP